MWKMEWTLFHLRMISQFRLLCTIWIPPLLNEYMLVFANHCFNNKPIDSNQADLWTKFCCFEWSFVFVLNTISIGHAFCLYIWIHFLDLIRAVDKLAKWRQRRWSFYGSKDQRQDMILLTLTSSNMVSEINWLVTDIIVCFIFSSNHSHVSFMLKHSVIHN